MKWLKRIMILLILVIFTGVSFGYSVDAQVPNLKVGNFLDFINTKITTPVIPTGNKTELPLWFIALLTLFFFSIFWVLVKQIPVFKYEKKASIIIALTLALIIVLISPALGWFLYLIGSSLWIINYGMILVFIISIYLIYLAVKGHGTKIEGKLKQTYVEGLKEVKDAEKEELAIREEEKLKKDLKRLDGDLKRLIKDSSKLTHKYHSPIVIDKLKSDIKRILNDLSKVNRVEIEIDHTLANAHLKGLGVKGLGSGRNTEEAVRYVVQAINMALKYLNNLEAAIANPAVNRKTVKEYVKKEEGYLKVARSYLNQIIKNL